ncbi:hypothetical protein [Streptomyces sp. NPDC026673]|uniref:hypothetical protein n=1 Tax=Streptomyces sp. NPDC026673 TaxID=3155724 RepID=UPI003400A34F
MPPAIDPALPAGERDVDRMPTGPRIARAVGVAAPPARRYGGYGGTAGTAVRRVRRYGGYCGEALPGPAIHRPTSCGGSCGGTVSTAPCRRRVREARRPPAANTNAAVLAIAEQAAGLTGTAA